MLRNLSIRAKLAVLLVVPLLLLLVAVVATTAREAVATAERRHLAAYAGSTATINEFFTALQAERKDTVEYLAAPGEAGKAKIATDRAATDAAIAKVTRAVADSGIDLTSGTTAAVYGALRESLGQTLPQVRSAVDNASTTPVAALSTYSDVSSAATDLTVAVAEQAGDRDMAQEIGAFGYLLKRVDSFAVEQAAGSLVLEGQSSPAVQALRETAVERGAYFEQQARYRLRADDLAQFDAQLSRGATTSALAFLNQDRNLFAASSTPSLTVAAWQDTTGQVIAAYQGAIVERAANVADEARAEASRDTVQAVVLLAAALLLFAAVGVVGFRTARGIGRRLAGLAAAATEVRDELPRMVERMQTPGEGPGVEFTPLQVGSQDEIGEVTKVINDLNETTFRIAGEQAALRASIAEMFVNVARRDQTLLARQLAFLDQLERTEENPDTLEDLFTLDHLATRMRRNAESLLVLAGINTGRRLRRPLPLSDVVRTAAGEIEHYDRVDLALRVDPPVVGHLALSASHMIAELLENATNFSDPGSRVVVGTAETGRGVEVTITDVGLGMSAEEVETAHQRISGGRASEFVGAQRLGFYVVGRLAGRLDVEVEFETSEGRGTTVTLVLPAALFTPGSVEGGQPELAALDSGLPQLGQPGQPAPSTGVSALPDVSALPEVPSALPGGAATGGLPTRTPAPTGPNSIVGNPLAASGLGDALSETLSKSAAEAAASSEVGVTSPKAKVEGRQLPTRRRSAQAQAEVDAAPTPAAPPTVPPVPEADWKPAAAPATSGGAVMPKRERKEPVPTALAAAQDILPKAGKKPRQVRESATPPKTAAEAFWTSRKRADVELKGSALDALDATRAEAPAPAPAPAPVVETPTPVVETPAPVVDPVVPVVETPAPVVEAPAPVVETPAPVAEPVVAPVAEPVVAPAAAPTAGRTVGEALRQRNALAAEALNALTEGQNFTPSRGTGSAPLVRRQAGATPAAAKPAPARAAANRQRRAPADVRSMLSGFQAGVSRGRAGESPADTPAAPESGAAGEA